MLQVVTMGLHAAVSVLLLLGVCFLTGTKPKPTRVLLAAGLGGSYAGICLLPGFGWMGHTVLRFVQIGAMAVVAYGRGRRTAKKAVLLMLLYASLEGLALGLFSGTALGLLVSAAAVAVLCFLGFHGAASGQELVEVEIAFRGRQLQLTALRDTGHFLLDPVTGEEVLIAGADTAYHLLGLHRRHLEDPVGTMQRGDIRGLRLIPCRTVSGSGLLLAVECDRVRIDGVQTGRVVAFSPEKLGISGEFEALTGGKHG